MIGLIHPDRQFCESPHFVDVIRSWVKAFGQDTVSVRPECALLQSPQSQDLIEDHV